MGRTHCSVSPWNETDAGCGTFLLLSLSLFLSLTLTLSLSLFCALVARCPASTCGEWKEPSNRRVHERRFFFLFSLSLPLSFFSLFFFFAFFPFPSPALPLFKAAPLCFRARATFQYRIVVLKKSEWMRWRDKKKKKKKKRGGTIVALLSTTTNFMLLARYWPIPSILPLIYIYIGRLSEVGGEERKWNAVRFAVEGIN